jgi:hypothetical protein
MACSLSLAPPCQLQALAGQERGRAIPLPDIAAGGHFERWCARTALRQVASRHRTLHYASLGVLPPIKKKCSFCPRSKYFLLCQGNWHPDHFNLEKTKRKLIIFATALLCGSLLSFDYSQENGLSLSSSSDSAEGRVGRRYCHEHRGRRAEDGAALRSGAFTAARARRIRQCGTPQVRGIKTHD